MNILIVDDQKAVADSLTNALNWEKLGIKNCYTAYSAMEAKLIMMNFAIDILVTDIEMPEEDGLSLFKWTREKYPNIVGVFLTSHADFEYAREAIQLGGFDYILQPARNEDIEKTLLRAIDEVKKKNRYKKLEEATQVMEDQRDSLMELFLIKVKEEKFSECEAIYKKMQKMFFSRYNNVAFRIIWIQILNFETKQNKWNERLIKLVFRNVFEELFEEYDAKVSIAKDDIQNYSIFAAMEEGTILEESWKNKLEDFAGFFNGRMDFKIAVYPDDRDVTSFSQEKYDALRSRKDANRRCEMGVFWPRLEDNTVSADNAERIHRAEEYIRANIATGISRTDVAEYVHLNEDYFTREFKKYTGYTYKDYETMVRMEVAKTTLEQTKLPVSVVASKTGYDNFSHFSKAFKKYTGKTPQEFRKEISEN